MLSRVYLAITKDPEHRGFVVQQGGAKTLIPLALKGTEKGRLIAGHALAKIAITTNPEIAFPGQRVRILVPGFFFSFFWRGVGSVSVITIDITPPYAVILLYSELILCYMSSE